MSDSQKTTVTVEIAGEEYTIRTEAAPEYATECARLVDGTISDILRQGPLVEAHKAVILAALSLADQLLQARADAAQQRTQFARLAARLAADIEAALASGQ